MQAFAFLVFIFILGLLVKVALTKEEVTPKKRKYTRRNSTSKKEAPDEK